MTHEELVQLVKPGAVLKRIGWGVPAIALGVMNGRILWYSHNSDAVRHSSADDFEWACQLAEPGHTYSAAFGAGVAVQMLGIGHHTGRIWNTVQARLEPFDPSIWKLVD